MTKRLIFAVLFLSVSAFGQGSWFQGTATTTNGASSLPTMLVVPNSSVTVCASPATGGTNTTPCTNKVPLCADATLTSCATVFSPSGPSNPVTADGVGNFGFWVSPGTYDVDVCSPAPTSCFIYGHQTLAAPGGGPGTFTTLTAKSIGGVQYAAQFAGSSTTCGIAEAYAALPSSGGMIVLQQGNCSASGWPVTIQKPILLVGQGMGGPSDPGTNASVIAGSSLTNTSTGSNFFVISLGSGTSVEGVTFKDFAMIGNKAVGGATAGDCVDINGGTTAQQVRAISFENIQCNQPKGSGFVIQDNAFIISFHNVHVDQSGSHCYVLKNGPNSGVNSQIHFIASTADLCGGSNASSNPGTADGWNISGVNSRSIDFIASTAADSNNGINVVAGATGAQIHVIGGDFETNTTADINLNDGYGHSVKNSTLLGTGVGARGILTNMPVGANFTQVQLLLDGNNISSHTVQDVTIGANQHTCVILPQAQNNYTFSDASLTCVKMDTNSAGAFVVTAFGGIVPSALGNGSLGSALFPWNNLFLFGKASQYNGISTVSNGVPSELATVDLTAQTAAIGTTTLYAVPAAGAGQYRLSWNAKVTTAAGTSSTLGPLTITYTDPDGVVLSFVVPFAINGATPSITGPTTNNTSTFAIGLPLMLNCKASTNIQYAFAYASNAAAAMAYNLHIKLEAQ